MDHIVHPVAAKEAREIEDGYAQISEELADRFWAELNEVIDEVFNRKDKSYPTTPVFPLITAH